VPAPLNETTAWSLLRAVASGPAGADPAVRVHHSASEDVWLHVEPTGSWRTSVPVSDEARELLALYLPLQLAPDLVIGQIGQSLDGRIATAQGHSHYITGPADITRLHRLRALVDAVVVGAGTVAADDPQLTVREVEGENPVRVVLDPSGRLSPDRAVFTDGKARTLVIHRAPDGDVGMTSDGNVLTLPTAGRDDTDGPSGFAPASVVEALHARGLRRILVEGGGVTVSRFLQAGALTRLHVTVAPLLIGSGAPALTLPPIRSLDQALRPPCRLFRLGDDVLFDLDLG
jgi:diaminohydroxyphosphoribosylaminopyrimidine deaminase/5-amino-6-(5-phosphoribosylamino)uracil reductase